MKGLLVLEQTSTEIMTSCGEVGFFTAYNAVDNHIVQIVYLSQYHFLPDMTVLHAIAADGASTNPCSDSFCGTSPASNPETEAVQNEADRLSQKLQVYSNTHNSFLTVLDP